MQQFVELTDKNFLLFAAKSYYNPRGIDVDEFHDELKRFNYLKRLITKHKQAKDIDVRLIINHLVVLFNLFGEREALHMLEYKVGMQDWFIIKPFLIYLNKIEPTEYVETQMDEEIVRKLREL